MLRVGLTGGIGTGKSTVADLFAEHGINIIDADVIAHQITASGSPFVDRIAEHFGQPVLNDDHTLNRKQLGDIVFHNPEQKQWLENLLHPEIRKQMQEQILNSTSPYCICVIPLLSESKHINFIDRVLVVDAAEQLQIERAKHRDQAAESKIQAIINSQHQREQRLAIADDVIINDGTLEDLAMQVQTMHEKYLQLSK